MGDAMKNSQTTQEPAPSVLEPASSSPRKGASTPMADDRVPAGEVHSTLNQHILADGMSLVLDLDRSTPLRLVDGITGREYFDFFSFFASAPLGTNHPAMLTKEAQKRIAKGATNNPSNSDLYTREMADFVKTYSRVAIPPELPHLFLVAGGALAVENALKTAFDWKVKKNIAAGRGEIGTKILHFDKAFHGRSGYTLSLTNTSDPRKTAYFPKFDWPRVPHPGVTFPLEGANLAAAQAAENTSIAAIRKAFAENPHDIAAIIIEPIQGEGGDNHFRPEFLQKLKEIAVEEETLLIADEVQTGLGLTGTTWAYQQLGFLPDILCFGKKMQVCGILAGERIGEVENNVFKESSRINSTWGSNLADMVRATLYLEIIERDNLVENARIQGELLLQRLQELQASAPDFISNARGKGLMCAVTCPSGDARDSLLTRLQENGVLMLPCGDQSVRFRPALCVTKEDIEEGMKIVTKTVNEIR